MKKCGKCKQDLPEEMFGIAAGRKLQGYCKPCMATSRAESRERVKMGQPSPQALRVLARKELLAAGTKICPACERPRAVADFSKNSSGPDGLAYECRECCGVRKQKEWRENPEQKRRTNRKSKYGILPAQFAELLQKQNNACACCGSNFTRTPHVDHCHKIGTVRGLLCGPCNTGIGNLKDSVEILEKALVYLRKFLP